MKRVALELGGKSPNIVFADADFETAVDNALTAAFLHSGQVCSAGCRLIVEDSIHDRFVEELARRADRIRLGHGTDEATETGALISADHRDRVERYIELGVSEGARLVTGGSRPTEPELQDGFYLRPTVFADCTPDMTIVREEVFGPVVTVERFTTEDEAVRLGNDTDYGLAGAVWTADASRAQRVAGRLRHGTVWINEYNRYLPQAEWGGFKQSGIGRELGPSGLDEYREAKHIYQNTAPAPDRLVLGRIALPRVGSRPGDYPASSDPNESARPRARTCTVVGWACTFVQESMSHVYMSRAAATTLPRRTPAGQEDEPEQRQVDREAVEQDRREAQGEQEQRAHSLRDDQSRPPVRRNEDSDRRERRQERRHDRDGRQRHARSAHDPRVQADPCDRPRSAEIKRPCHSAARRPGRPRRRDDEGEVRQAVAEDQRGEQPPPELHVAVQEEPRQAGDQRGADRERQEPGDVVHRAVSGAPGGRRVRTNNDPELSPRSRCLDESLQNPETLDVAGMPS